MGIGEARLRNANVADLGMVAGDRAGAGVGLFNKDVEGKGEALGGAVVAGDVGRAIDAGDFNEQRVLRGPGDSGAGRTGGDGGDGVHDFAQMIVVRNRHPPVKATNLQSPLMQARPNATMDIIGPRNLIPASVVAFIVIPTQHKFESPK